MLVAVLVTVSPSALDAEPLQALQVLGSGTAETNCAPTLTAGCTITTMGTAAVRADGSPILEGVFEIRVDIGGQVALNGWPGGSPGVCAPATYLGRVRNAAGDTLSFSLVGTVCEETTTGSPYHFAGSFRITPGTGSFAAVAGAGAIALTMTRTDPVVFVSMTGAISY
jgi:hypothetical protein